MNKLSAGKAGRALLILIKRHPFLLVPPIFYGYTLCPGIGYGDTAIIIQGAKSLVISTHVNNHNITIILAWVFSHLPIGNLALAVNITSAFAGSIAVLLFYFLLAHVFRSRVVAAFTAAALMISQSVWWHSTIIESYAINAIFTVGMLWLVVLYKEQGQPEYREGHRQRLYLYALFGMTGVAMFNHIQMGALGAAALVLLVAYLYRLRRQIDAGQAFSLIFNCLVVLVLGLLPYILTLNHDIKTYGFATAIHAATGGDFQTLMFKGQLIPQLKDDLALILQQFPSPFILVIILGLLAMYKKWRLSAPLLAILAVFLINTGFFTFYSTWDKYAFMLPSFVILAFAGGFGVQYLVSQMRQRGQLVPKLVLAGAAVFSLISPPYFYANANEWAKDPQSIFHNRYGSSGYDNLADPAPYILNPNKHNFTGTEDFAMAIFRKLPQNAIYIDDDSRGYYIIETYFRQYYHRRPDLYIQLINSWGFDKWGLSKDEFSRLLNQGFVENRQLFIVTTIYPFSTMIDYAQNQAQHLYRFEKYPLDDTHYVYRLLTASETDAAATEAYTPTLTALKVGLDFNTLQEKPQTDFTSQDAIMVKLEMEPNEQSFPVFYRWYAPGGNLFFESPTVNNLVPPGNTGTWNFLQKNNQAMPAGTWRVEAYINGQKIGEKTFTVR